MQEVNWGAKMQKKWFNSQLEYWGRNGCKVLNPFLSSISEEAQEFRTNFDKSLVMKLLDIKSRYILCTTKISFL